MTSRDADECDFVKIGWIGEIADAIEQVWRFAGYQDDRPRRPKPHDFVRGEQRAALEMFADAAGRAARPEVEEDEPAVSKRIVCWPRAPER